MQPTTDNHFYRDSSLLFWIYVLCTSKMGDNLPAPGKPVKKIPKEVRNLDADTKAAVFHAIDQGICWFIKLEAKGWRTQERNGAKEVQQVQSVLDWLGAFDSRSTVGGSQLLYAVVESKGK